MVRGNYEVATEEERAYTIKVAEKLAAKLDEEGFPTLVRPILPSHVAGCFWLVFSFFLLILHFLVLHQHQN